MNKYIIIISVIILLFIIYYLFNISHFFKTLRLDLENYGKLNITNCAFDVDNKDNDCIELHSFNDGISFNYEFTDTYIKNNIVYIIKLIANFLKYLNTDYTNNNFNISNIYNQKFIKSNIDKKPIGISFSNENKSKVFIVFRGTQTATDLSGDTNYNYYNNTNTTYYQDNNDIKIHKFYYSLYQEIKQQILDCLYTNTTDIYICGHSMGAAISFVIAEDISKNIKYNVYVYGIAPPKAGNKQFVDSLKRNCKYVLAVINMSDVVPTLPYTYMPNLIKPYTPVQFVQITPAVVFNYLNLSINACHQPISYYKGIKNDKFAYLG